MCDHRSMLAEIVRLQKSHCMKTQIIVCRKLRSHVVIYAAIAACMLSHQTFGECEEKAGTPAPQIARQKLWESLIANAGQPQEGLILEARLLGKSAGVSESVSMILSVKNVSTATLFFLYQRGEIPDICVHDANGVPAKLRKERMGYHQVPGFPIFSTQGPGYLTIGPGAALGAVLPLSDYFIFDKPGNFTVLATFNVEPRNSKIGTAQWNWRSLVANPFVIEVRPRPAPEGQHSNEKSQCPSVVLPRCSKEPTDRDWTMRVADAGKPIDGCVLEAIDSPTAPGEAQLVVSLVCEDVPAKYSDRVMRIASVDDCRVLIRSSCGNVVPPVQPAPTTTRDGARGRPESKRSMSFYVDGPKKPADPPWYALRLGDAMGAIIPLKKYFDLTKPGEYWVLVSLPSGRAGGRDWVSKPVKVRVGGEPPVSRN
jgi:hypothetical protein